MGGRRTGPIAQSLPPPPIQVRTGDAQVVRDQIDQQPHFPLSQSTDELAQAGLAAQLLRHGRGVDTIVEVGAPRHGRHDRRRVQICAIESLQMVENPLCGGEREVSSELHSVRRGHGQHSRAGRADHRWRPASRSTLRCVKSSKYRDNPPPRGQTVLCCSSLRSIRGDHHQPHKRAQGVANGYQS